MSTENATNAAPVHGIVIWLLKRRYGVVHAIAPPIGWAPWQRPTLVRRLRYYWKRKVWECDRRVFKWFGKPIRDEWKRRFIEG